MESSDIIAAISALFSGIAVLSSAQANRRSQKLDKELSEAEARLSKELAAAEWKPLLKVETISEVGRVAVTLKNYGNGTAVITSANFTRADKSANSLVEVLGVPSRYWPTYYGFPNGKTYLAAQSSFRLAELSDSFLNENRQPAVALEQMRKNLNEISIEIYYQDILGHSTFTEQTKLVVPFKQYGST